ncbi:hypothetical protein J6590_098183 [Homalodisca vitripennis]|nr:hypothetical protein J6590_098183 [Homalodisca vitripennis]
MKFFDLNNIPKTVSWIKKLSIEEACEQCKLWGIKPKDKLDAMRVQLNEFVARSSEGVVSDLEESADEPRIPVTDDLVDNPSLKQDEVETCTVLPPLAPVDLSGLVKSLHTMTLHAIEATAKTVAQEFATQNRPNNRDDVSFHNILRDMLREVPITSGTDLFQLTEFLVKIQKIVELNLGSDKTILLNAVARTEGRLRDVWMGLVSADYTWPNALQTIRLTFFSSRTIRDIQSKLMYRQQRPSEPYADYLADIVSIFQILGPEISDAEIFSTIFTGLNPHTRAAFAGLQAPTTVQQLKNMVSMIESLTVNSVKAPLGYGKSESQEAAIDSDKNVTYDNTNLQYAGHLFQNNRYNNRTFYRGSGRNFVRDTAKRTPYSTFYPNHSFGGNQRQGSWPYNSSRPYQNFHSQPNNSRQGQGNSLKGLAFPKKTRPINPLAPALPKVKPVEIPITFSNIKSSAVIDTGSTRSIVAKSVFDALSKLKGVVKKVEETSLTATAANGSDVSFKFLAHIHFKLACFSWTFPFLVANNLPVPVLIGLDLIQASEMSINAAQRQVSFPFDTSLVIAENQEDEQAEEVSLGPIFGERLDNS